MNRIIILIGVSGSGKSTYARHLIRTTPNNVIVSMDSARMSLFGYTENNLSLYYQDSGLQERERMVTEFNDNQIWYAIEKGYDVIADNTHLQKTYINAYKQFGVYLHLVFMNDITQDVAILRDIDRVKSVGRDVLAKQFKQLQSLRDSKKFIKEIFEFNSELTDIFETCKKVPHDPQKPDCVIFDVDNTLGHKGDRGAYEYHKAHEDSLDESVRFVFEALYESGEDNLIVCSGREGTEMIKKVTVDWLSSNGIWYSEIHFRKAGDMRKDWMVKAEIWRELQKKYNIIALFDDRVQVVQTARRLGHKVLECERGDF